MGSPIPGDKAATSQFPQVKGMLGFEAYSELRRGVNASAGWQW